MYAHRRRLPRAVGTQERDHASRVDLEAELVDGTNPAEVLGQAVRGDLEPADDLRRTPGCVIARLVLTRSATRQESHAEPSLEGRSAAGTTRRLRRAGPWRLSNGGRGVIGPSPWGSRARRSARPAGGRTACR